MILGQHKAAQFRPEVAIHPARQRRHDQLPGRRQPALPAIADAAGPQDQVLNDEIGVALKPRAGWHRGLDDLVFNGHARRHRTAAALAKMRRLWLAGLLHSARFERWPALEPFQPCDLGTLGRYRLLQGRHLAQQPDDKRLQFSRGECVEVTGWSHPSRESEASVSGKRKPRCPHPFCRCYAKSSYENSAPNAKTPMQTIASGLHILGVCTTRVCHCRPGLIGTTECIQALTDRVRPGGTAPATPYSMRSARRG